STISRHLAYLLRSELVELDRREWKFSHYRLAEPASTVHRNLVKCVRTCFRGVGSLDEERARAEVAVRLRKEGPCDMP
ncbi:MAG: hypothetical protein ACREL6_13565, partial [Gemmatimonadales bacterium]